MTEQPKKKRGPRKPSIRIECDNVHERDMFKRLAASEGMSVPDFVKDRCLKKPPKKILKTPYMDLMGRLLDGLWETRKPAEPYIKDSKKIISRDLLEQFMGSIIALSDFVLKEYNEHKRKSSQ